MDREAFLTSAATHISRAASLIRGARYLTAFTGAGISVESGIPPFRGEGGLWSKYDPRMLELDYFLAHPEVSWPVLKEIFYDHFGAAKPNRAHEVLAAWEARGLLKTADHAEYRQPALRGRQPERGRVPRQLPDARLPRLRRPRSPQTPGLLADPAAPVRLRRAAQARLRLLRRGHPRAASRSVQTTPQTAPTACSLSDRPEKCILPLSSRAGRRSTGRC